MRLLGTSRLDFQKYGPLLALVILFVVSSFSSRYFLQVDNLLNILRQVSYTGIMALGMTFVIMAGGIDLSVGSMTAFVGGVVVLLLNQLLPEPGLGGEGRAILLASLAGIGLGAVCGAINGLLVTAGRVAAFIATLGTMAIFRSVTLYIGNAGEFRSNSALYPELGMGRMLGIPNPVWAFGLLALLFAGVLKHTRYGRYTCAVGANARVARYAAIKVEWIRFLSYVILGASVGVAAVFLSSRLNSISSTTAGLNFELDAIAAVIIGGTPMSGGTGTIGGTVIGTVTLGIINNMLNMLGVSPYLQGTVKGLVIIGAVLLQRRKT